MAPKSVANYLSALWAHQRLLGYPSYPQDYALCLTLRGLRRLKCSSHLDRLPLSHQDLLLLYEGINTLLPLDLTFWAALTLAFRGLLRVCHYTSSTHNLRWKDISIYPDHLVLVLPSSKTDQFSDKPHRLVLNSSSSSPVCPVFWLSELARIHTPLELDYIFRIPVPGGLVPITAPWFNHKLKSLASEVGLDSGRVSSHSLRHGGASFMSAHGADMLDIRARGAWASSAIYSYLHHSDSTLRQKDALISKHI